MTFAERIVRFIRQLDRRELYQFIGAILGIVVLLMSFSVYRYYAVIRQLQGRLQHTNQLRADTQNIINEYDKVRDQQRKVETLIKHDESFKINQFFIESVQKVNLQLSKEPTVTTQDLVEGYQEVRLEAQLIGISTQQLTELLQVIEQNERLCVKDVKITLITSPKRALDVTLVVATFEISSPSSE